MAKVAINSNPKQFTAAERVIMAQLAIMLLSHIHAQFTVCFKHDTYSQERYFVFPSALIVKSQKLPVQV